eukprot:9725997-Lingulodinium_polyedra.AAC.1
MVRDIFHREWNDCTQAIKHSGLWWVILLTTMAWNLCYGPWEGCAWYEKIKGGASEFFALERATNPLFSALYGRICQDQKLPAPHTVAHKEAMLQQTQAGEAFTQKGPRITLK